MKLSRKCEHYSHLIYQKKPSRKICLVIWIQFKIEEGIIFQILNLIWLSIWVTRRWFNRLSLLAVASLESHRLSKGMKWFRRRTNYLVLSTIDVLEFPKDSIGWWRTIRKKSLKEKSRSRSRHRWQVEASWMSKDLSVKRLSLESLAHNLAPNYLTSRPRPDRRTLGISKNPKDKRLLLKLKVCKLLYCKTLKTPEAMRKTKLWMLQGHTNLREKFN